MHEQKSDTCPECAEKEKRIQELERRLATNSANSSKPPSSDSPYKKPKPQSLRPKAQNKSGGQFGHKGHTLQQVENPNNTIIHPVHNCSNCGLSLHMNAPDKMIKRQVFEVPPINYEVTEHQVEVKTCACGHTNTASFPDQVTAPVQYGSRVKALCVYFLNQQLIPEDRVQQIFTDVLNLNISTASLIKFNNETAEKINPIQEQVLESLKSAPFKHLDESGLRVGNKLHWLQVISDSKHTHYRVSQKRKDLLENVSGIVVHDHFKPYFQMTGVLHALCNAHHLRELKALEEIEKESWAKRMGQFMRMLPKLQDPPLGRIFDLYDWIVDRGFKYHLAQPQLSGRKKRTGHNLLLRLKNFKGAILRFMVYPGLPFTNNQAEQDIRMIKVKQKISGGFRTTNGAETFCTIRGFVSTTRKQNNNIFAALQSVVT